MNSFEKNLGFGKIGEDYIARWLIEKGYSVLPVYEVQKNTGKGPVLYLQNTGEMLVAPDLLAFRKDNALWIEAKRKSAFTWHRKTKRWVTGIDLHHYRQYLQIQNSHPEFEIWLLFLHCCGIAKDTPNGMKSPHGLFGNRLKLLEQTENHRHQNHGRHGMVYWSDSSLKLMASLSEVSIELAAQEYFGITI